MKNKISWNIAVFLFSVIFVYGLANFSYFESYEALYPTFFSGSITEGLPVNVWYFVSHFLLAEIYLKFYGKTSDIPWYEIILFFYVAVSLFTILIILLKQNQASIVRKIILTFLSLLLITEFILVFQYTRVAFALGIASTLALYVGGKNSKIIRWLSCVLFVFCLLTRTEVGVFVFLIQLLGILLIVNHSYAKTVLIFNSTVFVLVMGYITYDRLTTNDFLKQFEPELGYQLLDRGNIIPLSSMTNAVDSAKYIAVVNLITDQEFTTIDFLTSLVHENAYIGMSKKLLLRSIEILLKNINHSSGLFIIYITLLIFLIKQSIVLKNKKAFKVLLFNTLIWMVIIITIYIIKMEVWVFSSLLVMMCFILIFMIDYETTRQPFLIIILSGALILIGTFIYYQKQHIYIEGLANKLQANVKFTNELKKRYRGKILVPGLDQNQMILYSLKPFQMHDFSAFSQLYLFDADVVYIEDHYNSYLRNECKCNAKSHTDFMDFLDSKKDSVRIVSTHERIEVIKYYCKVVRNKNYNIIPIDSLSIDGNKATVFTFK